MDEPLPLRDDPDAPQILRRDLAQVAAHPIAFDVEAELTTLHGSVVFGRVFRLWPWLAVVGVGLGVALWPSTPSERAPAEPDAVAAPQHAAGPQAAEPRGAEPRGAVQAPAPRPAQVEPSTASLPTQPGPPAAESDGAEADAPDTVRRDGERAAHREHESEPSPALRSQDEIAHMARLRTTAARDPRAALRMVREDGQLFHGGLFDEEREAMQVLLLAQLGQTTSARRLGARFLSRYPQSAFAPRVAELVNP